MPERKANVAAHGAILASTLLWGTLWIPLRRMAETGQSGVWATTAGFLLPLLVLFPFALGRWRRIRAGGLELGIAGLLLALSIALYAEGLVRGPVARVILLFYLTPAWSTLLARALLGIPITGRRVVTIVLGLAGMIVIFGTDSGAGHTGGTGPGMGLASGVVWGLAMVTVSRTARRPSFDRIFVHFVFLGPVFLLVSQVPGGASLRVDVATLLTRWPWLLAFALLWMLPVVWLTLFGASRLDPGRVAIFLMLEIVVGLVTAALLAGEPFGASEGIGALLILGASGAEALAGPGPSAPRRA